MKDSQAQSDDDHRSSLEEHKGNVIISMAAVECVSKLRAEN